MGHDTCEKSCHEAITNAGFDPAKYEAEIKEALNHSSVKALFGLVDKVVADPASAAQCSEEGDERLAATVLTVKGICDQVAADLNSHRLKPSPLLKKVIKSFDEMENEIQHAKKKH